jgi:hypothetical protein
MNSAIAAARYRHQREQHHLRHEQPGIWVLGKLGSLAGGGATIVVLHRATHAGDGRLLLTLFGLLAGIATFSALRTYDTVLTSDAARLTLPLPLDPANRWRSAVLSAALSSGLAAIVLVVVALLTAGWQWAIFASFWLPVAWSFGAGVACILSWSLSGGSIRWRALILLFVIFGAIMATVHLLTTSNRPLPPLMLLPDALIFGGLLLGPGAPFIGRAMIPIVQQVAIAPSRSFAAFPRLVDRIGRRLERYPDPAFAIIRKDLVTQSRDAFTLIRVVPIAGVLPLSLLLDHRLSDYGTESARIAFFAIALAFYGMMELRPSPFGGEGNRLMLALQSPIDAKTLFIGKTLGVLTIELPQAWLAVTIATIGTGGGPAAWAFAIVTTSVAVAGLGIILTAASVRDIDLERRVDDRTQAILVEHIPFGAWRMLGLGTTCLATAGSGAALLVLPSFGAFVLLVTFHAGCSIVMSLLAIQRLTKLRA